MAGLIREPVRVVIINTQYVETDVRSFKSVVQEFTGKDSAPPGNSDHKHLKRGLSRKLTSMDEIREKRVRLDVSDKVSYAGGDQVLMRDLSFKEFEGLLKEMPSMDELYRSCCPASIGWVNAQSLIRAYAYNADENEVAYGQTTDAHKTTNMFQVESITGHHMAMDICSICFSVFSVVSLFVFFYIEKRKSKRSQ